MMVEQYSSCSATLISFKGQHDTKMGLFYFGQATGLASLYPP
jgi:hypothetical protein